MEYADISDHLHCYVHYRMAEVGLHGAQQALTSIMCCKVKQFLFFVSKLF